MFADSLLFDMMLNTAYEDGVDTHQDLIDRDMTLGIIRELIIVEDNKLIFSYRTTIASRRYEIIRLRTLQNTRNNNQMYFFFIFHKKLVQARELSPILVYQKN